LIYGRGGFTVLLHACVAYIYMPVNRATSAPAIRPGAGHSPRAGSSGAPSIDSDQQLRRTEIIASATAEQARLVAADRDVGLAPTRAKKLLHSSHTFKQHVVERDRWEEERRRQVANEREARVQLLLRRQQERYEHIQAQARQLRARKAEAAERREEHRKLRDAKHANAWDVLRSKQDLKAGLVRDKAAAFEILADRRREGRTRQKEKARREQEALDTMKLELGNRRRAVERQRQNTSLDPAARAAMEQDLAVAEADFLKATARAKRAAQAAMLAQSEEDRQRVEQAVRDAAKRTVSRSSSSIEIFKSVSGNHADRGFGGRHGLESAMARFAAQADGRWP
jgi:hypothetical protein